MQNMERNWTPSELTLVNKLFDYGKLDDDIYYILSDELKKYRERYISNRDEYQNRELNGMNINELLFDLDKFNINYNSMTVEKILRFSIIDTLASTIAYIPNSQSPYNIMVNAYLSHPGLAIIDLDIYDIDVWGFYILLENSGIDVINLFTSQLAQLRRLNTMRDCNTYNSKYMTMINNNRV